MSLSGVAASDIPLPGVREAQGWAQLRAQWAHGLNALAADIRAGVALPAPRTAAVCARCHLAGFCRIDEAAAGTA